MAWRLKGASTLKLMSVHRRFIYKGVRAPTHRELIREWRWEPKGSSLEYILVLGGGESHLLCLTFDLHGYISNNEDVGNVSSIVPRLSLFTISLILILYGAWHKRGEAVGGRILRNGRAIVLQKGQLHRGGQQKED